MILKHLIHPKFRRRLYLWIIVLLIIFFSHSFWLDYMAKTFGLAPVSAKTTTTSFLYQLSEKQALTFSFPPCSMLKMVTNATIPLGKKTIPGTSLTYCINYKLLDRDNKEILTKDYYHAATLTYFQDIKTGEEYLDSSLSTSKNEIPMDGKIIYINFKNIKSIPRQVKVTLKHKQNPLINVFVRLYWQQQFPPRRLKTIWQRKSRKTKTHLARGNIYPVDLLSNEEQKNLVTYKWEVLAPLGIPQENFNRVLLFTLKEHSGSPIIPQSKWLEIKSGEIFMHSGLKGVIPIPERGGNFQFTFSKLNNQTSKISPKGDGHSNIHMTWFGKEAGEILKFSIPCLTPQFEFQKELKGGTIEISSPIDMTVKVVQQNEKKKKENFQELNITPEPNYVRTYTCDSNQELLYSIFHPNKKEVPFRIDLRCFLDTSQVSPMVTLQFLDHQGNIIKSNHLFLTMIPSVYDRPVQFLPGNVISEKTSYYFLISSEIQALRILNTGSPVLICVYNRPFLLEKQIRVPEDYFDYHRYNNLHRTWFYLNPAKHDMLIQQNKGVSLNVQYRPPEINQNVLSGKYHWELLIPFSTTRGRMLFLKRESHIPLRKNSWPIMFREIFTDKETEITFGDPFTKNGSTLTINPQLVFFNTKNNKTVTSSTPIPIKLFIDGQLHWQDYIFGSNGEIPIKSFTGGVYQLRLEGPPHFRFFINKTNAKNQTLFYRRLAYPINTQSIVFRYKKEYPQENLNIKLFAPFQSKIDQRIKLKISIKKVNRKTNAAYQNWTILQRIFNVRPNEEKTNFYPVLRTPNEKITEGESLFFPIGEDVPNGTYKIFIQSPQDAKGYYLLVNRLIPVITQERVFEIIRSENDP